MVRRLWADNYKSLRGFDLELRRFNVLVGANGSGKTNVLDSLRFIQEAVLLPGGLADAVALRGGPRGVVPFTNRSETCTLGFSVELGDEVEVVSLQVGEPAESGPNLWGFGRQIEYETRLLLSSSGARALHEHLGTPDHPDIFCERNEHIARFLRGDRTPSSSLLFTSAAQLVEMSLPPDRLALGYPLGVGTVISELIAQWQFIDLDPGAARQGTADLAGRRLSSTGANLAALLRSLRGESRESLINAVSRDVPGFRNFHTQEAGGQIFFTIDTDGASSLPAASVSDGTIRLLAVYALYYGQERPPLLCIEEPENGLHPDVIETVVEYLRVLSEETQVILTTHSPLLLDWCDPKDVILLDQLDGVTRAMRVDERSQIREFLREWTLGELWSRELLPVREVTSGTGAGSPG